MAAQILFLRERIANFCNEILVSINLPPRFRNIFDPLEEAPYKWTLVWVSIISTLLDPMFFYIFLVNDYKKCLRLDTKLMIAVCLLRFLVDLCHIIFVFYHERRRRIIFVVLDVLCILPLPQMVTLIIHRARGWEFIDALKWLKYTIIVQYLLKLVRICKSYVEAERAPGIPVEVIKWLNAASCFLIYLLPGHVFGGLWFFMAIERETDCWNEACLYYRRRSCGALHCDYHSSAGDNKFLGPYCPKIIRDTTIYDFGIFQDALQSGIVEETKFTTKLFYCLRWGLLTTSSMAQNLRTSTDVEENLFVISIYLTSLMLLVLVYGRLQIYLQSETQRLEERRLRARDTRQWGIFRMLPENLQRQVYAYNQQFSVEHYLNDLPEHLRNQIKRVLCLEVLRTVPQFGGMEEQFLNQMCNRLQPVQYGTGSSIVSQGELIRQMLFVMQGSLSTSMNGGGIVFMADPYWGELTVWAFDPNPLRPLPRSPGNLCAFTEVEAFALMAEDLREVVQGFLNAGAGQP